LGASLVEFLVTKYTPKNIKRAATILTALMLSLPIMMANIPAKTGCIYTKVLTVVALSFLKASGFNK
jgi:hypothetical protein